MTGSTTGLGCQQTAARPTTIGISGSTLRGRGHRETVSRDPVTWVPLPSESLGSISVAGDPVSTVQPLTSTVVSSAAAIGAIATIPPTSVAPAPMMICLRRCVAR